MSYGLHIEREAGAISETEWQQAIHSIEGIRLATGPAVSKNPQTGQEIQLGSRPPDAEIQFPDGQWHLILLWTGERATFEYSDIFENPDHEVRQKIAALAKALNAKIVGDEGETYDW